MRLEFEDGAMRLYAEQNLALAHWFGAPNVGHFIEIGRLAARQRELHSGGVAFVTKVSAAKLPRLSLGMRRQLRPVLQQDRRDLVSAHIIELPGVAGATARRIVSLVMGVLGHRAPSGVFETAPAAVDFLLAHLARGDVEWDSEALHNALMAR